MYERSAHFYDALYEFKDYGAGAEKLRAYIRQFHANPRTLLEVGCGTGKYLEQLCQDYEVEGLDINQTMLEIARERVPDVPLHLASMVDFELGKRFDVVACLFSSIGYVRTLENFHRTVDTLARHVAPGGLLIIEPFFEPEQYWVDHLAVNVVDQPNLKIVWMYVQKLVDRIARLDIHYMVGTPDRIEYFTERHDIGLFARTDFEESFNRVGFKLYYDPVGIFKRGIYVGTSKRHAGRRVG